MEKQRMKDIFKNLNMTNITRTKYFRPKMKVCRKLSFDRFPQSDNFSQLCSDILPGIGCEESSLQIKETEIKENNHGISLQTIANPKAEDTLIGENVQVQSLRSPAIKIISNVLLPKNFFCSAKVASSAQAMTVTNTEKIPPENILEENYLLDPPLLTTEDAPPLIETQQKETSASTATTASTNNIPFKSKISFVCKINLSSLGTIKNKFITLPQMCLPESTQNSSQKVLRNNNKSYLVSPINSNESDPDLSDSDPTYNVKRDEINKRPPPSLLLRSPRRNRSLSSSSSSSGSSSSDTASDSTVDSSKTRERKTRKRKGNPESWKFNTAKRLRNFGQSYVSVTSNKIVNARSVKPPCTEKCRLKCSEKVREEDRKIYFEKYWALKNVQLKRSYIKSCMVEVKPKYKYSHTENPRKSNNAFYFKQGDRDERVCKTFFINTLDITDRMIRTVKEKVDEQNFLAEDKRGKHNNHKKIDATLVADIRSFIDSIPRVESHYTRATSSCEYITPGKTLTEIYNDFVEQQQKNGRPSGKYCNFYEIFKDTGLKFHQPTKDLCDLCRDYKLTRNEELKEEFDKHQEEKDLSRKEKKRDRCEIDDNNICAVYDLEAILQAPLGKSSSFFYKTKMNCYNFTIAELAQKTTSKEESNKAYTNVYSYFWDETQGQKGSTEIATSVFKFLKIINDRSTSKSVKVTFYSDNCCGQNKNKFIATLYMYALTQFENIHCIIHKYLIKGHTQNENDNAHSLIEKEIQKFLKADTIYTPVQYIPLIKSAKKTGKKFQVQTLTFEDFINIKDLQTQWGLNFTKDTDRNPLTWNDVRILKFCKEEQFKFYFKTSYKDEEYREIDVRAGLRKSLPMVQDMVLGKAYNKRFELKENQKKDLKSLIDKKVIPPYYASYYNDVI